MPDDMVVGVPAHVDGRGIDIAGEAGAHLINRDRMWHYTEGMANWDPIWPGHGIRIIPGPSSLWFDAEGNRLPEPLIPGADTVATMKHILATGQHSRETGLLGLLCHVLHGLVHLDRRGKGRCLDAAHEMLANTYAGLEEVGMTNLASPLGY